MRHRIRTLALLACITWSVAGAAEPVTELLRYAPEGAEVVAGVDVTLLRAHPRFDDVFDSLSPARFNMVASQLEQATGVDLMNDILALALVGQLRENGEGALLVKGVWDERALVDLVSWSPTYEVDDVAGYSIHSWVDEEEDVRKYAAFLQYDVLTISDHAAAIARIVETAAGERKAIQVPALLAAGSKVSGDPPTAFMIASSPAAPGIRKNPVLSRVQAMSALCEARDEALTVTASARASDAHSAPRLEHALRGLIAMGELLDNASADSPWVIATAHQGDEVTARIDVPMANVVAAAGTLGKRRRGN